MGLHWSLLFGTRVEEIWENAEMILLLKLNANGELRRASCATRVSF